MADKRMDPMLTRRTFLGSSLLAAASLGASASAEQRGLAAIAGAVNLDPGLVRATLLALHRHHHMIWARDVIAIADFSRPSALPRFHLIDLLKGQVTTLLVAHGKGSDPDHSGYLQSFSNAVGSYATSEGTYVTGEAYDGIHGPSRRLIGLDPTDSNAEARAIVIHSAWYVGPDIVARQGRLGRSDGCFVFSTEEIGMVLTRLGRGRLIYAGRGTTTASA